MAIAYTLWSGGQSQATGSATFTSGTLTVASGDFITVMYVAADNSNETAWTVSNNGTSITWTKQSETNTASNCKVVLWTGTAGATPPTTVTVTATSGAFTNSSKFMAIAAHTGAHATTPLPAGNIYSGTGGTDVTQSITPTASGSALWMVAGDWNQTNSFAAASNCTLDTVYDESGQMTCVAIRPTTQPRTDASAFTIGESDTSGLIAWIAFEVRASDGPVSITPGLGELTITGHAPIVLRSGDYNIETDLGRLSVVPSIPTVYNNGKNTPPSQPTATVTTIGTASASWAINRPAASAGDAVVFVLAWDDSTTVASVTAPSGVNSETAVSIAGPVASASTEMRMQAWYYVATGAWTTGTLTFTPAASETVRAVAYVIPAGQFKASDPIGFANTTASAGTAESTLNSPTGTAEADDGGGRLYIAYGSDVDAITAPASGTSTINNATGGGVGLCVVSRNTVVSNSESISNITASIASDSWASLAFVVKAGELPLQAVSGDAGLSLTGHAPSVSIQAGSNTGIETGLGQLVLTGLVPTVVSPLQLSAGLGELTLTGLVPTVTVGSGANLSITTGLGQLVITGYGPTQDYETDPPGTGALVLTGYAPSVNTGASQSVEAGLGALVLTGLVPSVLATANQSVDSGLGQLELTGLVPSVSVTANIAVASDLGTLTLAGLAPTVAITENQFVSADFGALTLTGLAPSVAATDNKTVNADLAALTITGHAPDVVASAAGTINTGLGQLALTGLVPTVERTDNQTITAGLGALIIEGLLPTVETTAGIQITSGLGELSLAGHAPTIAATANQFIATDVGELSIAGYAPVLSFAGNFSANPDVAQIIITGLEPGVVNSGDVGEERPSGGRGRKRPRWGRDWRARLPSEDEVRAERERLGILPKRAQEVVRATVKRATDVETPEQAAALAAAYTQDIQQARLKRQLKERAAAERVKWRDEMATISQALILDALRRKADEDALREMLEREEQEYMEAHEILQIFLQL